MPTIYIDAGHGGSDPGASGGSRYIEKHLVLDLALKVRDYLLNHFVCEVIMTRTNDSSHSLSARTNKANRERADFLLSIHYNAFNRKAQGYEDFVYTTISDIGETGRIRTAIHNEVVNRVLKPNGITNRGKKKANFHMLRESNMPAVLVETLFCDSPTDQRYIDNTKVMNNFVIAYAEGIGKGMGLRRKSVSVPSVPNITAPSNPSPVTVKLYRVQNGAYSSKANADDMVRRLKNAGFPAYTFVENGLNKVQSGAFSVRDNAYDLARRLTAKKFPAYVYYG